MSTRKYALVFSVITIVYLGLETLFQFVIGPAALGLSSRVMFCTFGSTLFIASFSFVIVSFIVREKPTDEYSHLPSSAPVDANASINWSSLSH